MNKVSVCAKVYPEGIQPIKGNNYGLVPSSINTFDLFFLFSSAVSARTLKPGFCKDLAEKSSISSSKLPFD